MSTTTVSQPSADAKIGLRIHAAVTVAVIALLVAINLLTVPELLWFFFPMAGMSAGLGVHYLVGHWLPNRQARRSRDA
ncbi:MAG: 2TM domain-containing protein [Actinomycetota bacterium]|jgi:hypothetical protein|nr:2TM domain-containing protein [Actinomycetota bacterium]